MLDFVEDRENLWK